MSEKKSFKIFSPSPKEKNYKFPSMVVRYIVVRMEANLFFLGGRTKFQFLLTADMILVTVYYNAERRFK